VPCAIHHHGIQINQFLPTALDQSLGRIMLHGGDGLGRDELVGAHPGLSFAVVDDLAVAWSGITDGIAHTVTLRLHPTATQWSWTVSLCATGTGTRQRSVVFGQDLGLVANSSARRQEGYISQYIDHRVERDSALGWVICSRQGQPQSVAPAGALTLPGCTAAGSTVHPWIAHGCHEGAASFATDGAQFFGADHRLTGRPACLGSATLPNLVQQQEMAFPALQSAVLELVPGVERQVTFFAVYDAHHAEPSDPLDLNRIRQRLAAPTSAATATKTAPAHDHSPHLLAAPLLHGDHLDNAALARWLPGERRHEERTADGRALAFFRHTGEHVVLRAKEEAIERPHGWVMRSGRSLWMEGEAVGVTVYAAGVFASQVYAGNPSLGRIISPVRDALGVGGTGGQRILMRQGDGWRKLGIPSAWVMSTHRVSWLYCCGADVVQVSTATTAQGGELRLEITVLVGAPRAFLITHQLAFGDHEMNAGGTVHLASNGWLAIHPGADSALACHLPGACAALVPQNPTLIEALGDDALLWVDGRSRGNPYAVIRTRPVTAFASAVVMARSEDALAQAVAQARASGADTAGEALARRTLGGLHLQHPTASSVSRINEILPWFAHHAWIHLSSPHGLEQCDGGALGTRDVSQGDLEWLLAVGAQAQARALIILLFSHQYLGDGSFPQYFLAPPFDHIQESHAHGDKPMWPLKAVSDYIAATNDSGILDEAVVYSDHDTHAFLPTAEPISRHVERLIAHIRTRLMPGTALINYGDGDWDDTLQPADPALRKTMMSAWTVELAYQAVSQYAEVCKRSDRSGAAAELIVFRDAMRRDFTRLLMPDGVVAGFAILEGDQIRPVIHPRDTTTAIRYRLLPMTRGIISGMFTPAEATAHAAIIHEHLLCPDGARLTSDPIRYEGGRRRLFQRAETAANFGREIGQLYMHAHIRYAEAMAHLGLADRLWRALQVINPIGLSELVPQAEPRQANTYFTSSDGAFADRYEAHRRYHELRLGTVPVKAGWRFHSSGPGLFISTVIGHLLGLRTYFGEAAIDPCLPRELDGLQVSATWAGRTVQITYHLAATSSGCGPQRLTIGGHEVATRRLDHPYRLGGLALPVGELQRLIDVHGPRVAVECG